MYTRAHGRPPSRRGPVSFTEKVNWRILKDRSPLLALTGDKLAMKQYASTTLPGLRIPATVWAGSDIAELQGTVARVGPIVLKPNHGSGQVLFISADAQLKAARARARDWMDDRRLLHWGEWAYTKAARLLLAEERLGRSELTDYKFFVFAGEVALVQVDVSRFSNHRRSLYTPEWTLLPHTNVYPPAPRCEPPALLPEMLVVAGALGAAFDFIRVDLYAHQGDVWFGELTPYPGSGLEPYHPRDLDMALGHMWKVRR